MGMRLWNWQEWDIPEFRRVPLPPFVCPPVKSTRPEGSRGIPSARYSGSSVASRESCDLYLLYILICT